MKCDATKKRPMEAEHRCTLTPDHDGDHRCACAFEWARDVKDVTPPCALETKMAPVGKGTGETPDHSQHGRGTAEDGPDDPDCPCRAGALEAECAKAGCGFCRAANRWRAAQEAGFILEVDPRDTKLVEDMARVRAGEVVPGLTLTLYKNEPINMKALETKMNAKKKADDMTPWAMIDRMTLVAELDRRVSALMAYDFKGLTVSPPYKDWRAKILEHGGNMDIWTAWSSCAWQVDCGSGLTVVAQVEFNVPNGDGRELKASVRVDGPNPDVGDELGNTPEHYDRAAYVLRALHVWKSATNDAFHMTVVGWHLEPAKGTEP